MLIEVDFFKYRRLEAIQKNFKSILDVFGLNYCLDGFSKRSTKWWKKIIALYSGIARWLVYMRSLPNLIIERKQSSKELPPTS